MGSGLRRSSALILAMRPDHGQAGRRWSARDRDSDPDCDRLTPDRA
jgi:hypothetical protein